MFLSSKASKLRIREAQNARRNRQEIVKGLADGQITRRDLFKWGLFTVGGMLLWKNGLNPFVRSAYASVPTGFPRSPLFGVQAFTQPVPRFDVLSRNPIATLNPAPTAQANTTQQPLNPALEGVRPGDTGPIEGRPPGPIWAHQEFTRFPPAIAVPVSTEGAKVNTVYDPGVPASLNSGINPATFRPAFHPGLPDQGPLALWTFNGTLPPKLLTGRYGEGIIFRHSNKLPFDIRQNGGFGIHTLSTHEHNGHHGAENDGFTGAFFYPGQFYDYHWPIVLAGFRSVNTGATDARAGSPNGSGGITKVAGDWKETMSTHWFHDHMFSFTAQNVYKGDAGMFNLYSALDRGNEAINDGVNLRLPNGTAQDFGNLSFDVNLMLADKAWDANGQLHFDIFDTESGFVADVMTVNLVYRPFFEVERRKYRFRILNGAVSRFFKISLSDASPMIQIANDGNLLPNPVTITQTDQLGIAERYDIVIDFSRYSIGQTVSMVNLLAHEDGTEPSATLSLSSALNGSSTDPCVGRFLEFRIVRDPAQPDQSQVPAVMIPNPDLSAIPVARTRTFTFGDGATQNTNAPVTSVRGPWGMGADGGEVLDADFGRISAAPSFGTREIWNLVNDGGGWDHPVHIHFEEGQILKRNGSASTGPDGGTGRKDG